MITAESDTIITIMYASRTAIGQTVLVLIDRASGQVVESIDLSDGEPK